jgi:cyanophycinase
MRRILLVAALFLSSLALAQANKWPQSTIRGTVVVWSGEKGKEVAKATFESLTRGSYTVVTNEVAAWPDAKTVRPNEPLALSDVRAVWLDSNVTADTEKAVLRIKQDGGTVALSAEALAKPSLAGLLPYVGFAFQSEGSVSTSAIVLELEPNTVLIAQGRTVSVRGEGSATLTLSGGKGGPSETVKLAGTSRADLVALQRRVTEFGLSGFPPTTAAVPEVKSGSLFIVGGGGMPDGLLEKFIEACGGPDAPIVYVPCEQAEVIPTEPDFVAALKAAGAKNVTWIHTKDRNKSDTDQEFLKPLKEAKGVWYGGGRQWNLVDSYQDTQAHELMRNVLERGGAIGGSSAGASIQAEFLARGDPLGNANIIAPGYTRGFGFLPGAAVDQHFTQRGRHKDMTLLMKTYPQLLGIGIDEATAIIVRGTLAEVTGRGQVFFYDYRTAPTGETDYVALKKGETYDLKERKKKGP